MIENESHHTSGGNNEVRNTTTINGCYDISTCRSTVLDEMLNALEKRYFGNRDALSMLLLSAASAHILFNRKLHIAIIGTADVGKTGALEAGLDFIHTRHKYPSTKVSPKSLYYEANEGCTFDNVIIGLDDIEGGDREILKNLANTSNNPPSFTTLVKQKPIQIHFDAQPVVWTTRVELLNDHEGQVDRRFFTIEIVPKDGVMQHMFDNLSENVDVNADDDFIHMSDTFADIMWRDQLVKIPKHNLSHIKRNSDMNFYVAMIRSIAKINTSDTTSNEIIASDADIKEATRLYRIHIVQTTSIKQDTALLLEYVPEDITEDDYLKPTESFNSVRAIYNDQKDTLGLSTKQVRTKLKELTEGGLIEETSGMNRTNLYCRFDD